MHMLQNLLSDRRMRFSVSVHIVLYSHFIKRTLTVRSGVAPLERNLNTMTQTSFA